MQSNNDYPLRQEFRRFVEALVSLFANPNNDQVRRQLEPLLRTWQEIDEREIKAKFQGLAYLHSSSSVAVDVGHIPPEVGRQMVQFLALLDGPLFEGTLADAIISPAYQPIARWLAEVASIMTTETVAKIEVIVEVVPEASEYLPPDLFALMLPYSITANLPDFVSDLVNGEQQEYRDPALALLQEYSERKEYLIKMANLAALAGNGLVRRTTDLTEEERANWRVPQVGPPFQSTDSPYPS